jgi:hypothetical protein
MTQPNGAIFDALSAHRRDDGAIVVSGHLHGVTVAFPSPVATLDDDGAVALAATLTALLGE